MTEIEDTTLRTFLSKNWKLVIILLALGFAWRSFLVIRFPHNADD